MWPFISESEKDSKIGNKPADEIVSNHDESSDSDESSLASDSETDSIDMNIHDDSGTTTKKARIYEILSILY